MAIKDLQVRQGNVELSAEVTEKGEAREFEKFGRSGKVCTAVIKDASGEIKLSLWNEQVDNVNVGDTVKISNGYVNEFQGEKQLTTGKFGKLEVVSKGQGAPEDAGKPSGDDAKDEDSSDEKDAFDEDVVEEDVDENKGF